MVASEVAPFAKTGGLADVLGALPPALARIGEEVAVVMPRYRVAAIRRRGAGRRQHAHCRRSSCLHGLDRSAHRAMACKYFFVNCPPLYDRPGIYGDAWGYADNHIRYALLNHAALAVARYLFHTDIFHVHDWQCGLLPVYPARKSSWRSDVLWDQVPAYDSQPGLPGEFRAVGAGRARSEPLATSIPAASNSMATSAF